MKKALEIAYSYGQIDGAHHKAWVIDQMVRRLLEAAGLDYDEWVAECCAGDNGPQTYTWDVGIAP